MVWGATWLYRATKAPNYWSYVLKNIHNVGSGSENINGVSSRVGSVTEFGWDNKNAGVNVLVSRVSILTSKLIKIEHFVLNLNICFLLCWQFINTINSNSSNPFIPNADKFVCSLLPESPTKSVSYSPGNFPNFDSINPLFLYDMSFLS